MGEAAPEPGVAPARAWRVFDRIRHHLATIFAVPEAELTAGSWHRPVAVHGFCRVASNS